MSFEPIRFPFFPLPEKPIKRPLVWLFLENLHDPDGEGFRYPALVDTGADCSAVPFSLCKHLGHVLEAGTSPSTIGGVGAGRVRTFKHATRITVLSPSAGKWMPAVDDVVFSPIEFQLSFSEQELSCILLGQSDFLNLFEYAQNRSEGWFSLRQL